MVLSELSVCCDVNQKRLLCLIYFIIPVISGTSQHLCFLFTITISILSETSPRPDTSKFLEMRPPAGLVFKFTDETILLSSRSITIHACVTVARKIIEKNTGLSVLQFFNITTNDRVYTIL